ncbi:chemotaxis protein CheW [soil metagenome]
MSAREAKPESAPDAAAGSAPEPATGAAIVIDDCWNRIGVHGDGSCERLAAYVHCRNCPVYSAAAIRILDRERPRASEAEAMALATRMAEAKTQRERDLGQAVFLFRIGSEWLGLPMHTLDEVADLRRIHSLPHRRNGVVLGVANVRGELLVCVSLGEQLGIETVAESTAINGKWLAHKRLLVLRRQGQRLACPVDEVQGNERFLPSDQQPVPSTVARASASYSRTMLHWEGNPIGLLDDELLFNALNRSLA